MDGANTPEDGDIVVRRDTRNGKPVFVLNTTPGPDQLVLHTRDAAVRQARDFARSQQVRVWVTNGNHDFTLVEDFRVGR
jgi:hypothetical protein